MVLIRAQDAVIRGLDAGSRERMRRTAGAGGGVADPLTVAEGADGGGMARLFTSD